MAELCPQVKNHMHMCLGIITEAGELADIFKKELAYGKPIDKANLKEEIGDLTWYIANLATHHDFKLDVFSEFKGLPADLNGYIKKMDQDGFNTALTVLEFGKIAHSIVHRHPCMIHHNNFLRSRIGEMLSALTMICILQDVNFEECLDLNINKLKVRFPEKFTEENALNRDLEAERTILES